MCFSRGWFILAVIFLVPVYKAYSQRCVSQERLSLFLSENKQASKLRESLEVETQHASFNALIENRTVVNIPVVFHIVWRLPEENISDAQILSQLLVLNKDFRLTNNTNGLLPAIFQPFAADFELNFCLAQRTPDGLPTNGIVRVNSQVPYIGDRIVNSRKAICYSTDGGSTAWDPERYLNIWVGARQFFPAEASFPGGAVPDEDGVIIAPHFVGTTGTAANNTPYHLGRTLTHEIGHYLNLYHLWGQGQPGSCAQSDEVADTPVQSRTYIEECPSHPQISCGSPDMFMNFMNYTDDACMAIFTLGQKNRAWAALNFSRVGLLNSDGCSAPSSITSIQPGSNENMRLLQNPVQDIAVLKMTTGIGGLFNWQLIASSGKCSRQGNFIGQDLVSLEIGGLPSGLYILRINGPGFQFVEKLVVVDP